MKRAHVTTLIGILTAIALVAACDQHVPLNPNINGGGGNNSGPKGAPAVSIDTVQPNPVNIGDSVLVAVHVRDDSSIATLTLLGETVKGSADLGTLTVGNRYSPITVGPFHPGLRDTVIRRYLHPVVPVDTSLDSLVIIAQALDNSSNMGADTVVARMVTGPRVSFITPIVGTQVFAGGDMGVIIHATHPDGIQSLTITAASTGTPVWPTPVSKTVTGTFASAPKDTTYSTTVTIPANAPVGGHLTFTASGIDINGKPGSVATITLLVKGIDTVPPLVTQVLAPRIEQNDSVTVNASGSSAMVILGVIVKDSLGNEIRRDSVPTKDTLNNVSQRIHIPLTAAEQGRSLRISTFAIDRIGKVGYSVNSNTTVAQPVMSLAWSDTTVVVYGTTYPIPNTPSGTPMGDIAVDPVHGNVFVSNINYNRLEVWTGATGAFAPASIPVGSQPWGLAFGNSQDTLYVANSGGTNISRVFVGAGTMGEVLSQRILTRDTYIYEVTETIDPNTSRITLSISPPTSYSDRPQYVAISKAGRLYYSTVPTAHNRAGTIRYLDPSASYPAPDPRQIWQYARVASTTTLTYQIFNVDSVAVRKMTGLNPPSDTLIIWDHPYGQLSGVYEARDPDVLTAAAKLAAQGSDIDPESGVSIPALALTDTTFVGISGDRTWIAFGEGNTGGVGRIMMVNDPSGTNPGFFSPAITVADLLDNANEPVFGVAVDSTGATVASHGLEAYFAYVDNPFHLRLQGKYDSFDNGAGIAFDPGAYGVNTPSNDRLAFVGSQSGFIEIVDIAYYINRGKLTLKGNLYGPLRASRPFPGDPPNVILKLFGLSSNGLVVIDLTAADIRPAP